MRILLTCRVHEDYAHAIDTEVESRARMKRRDATRGHVVEEALRDHLSVETAVGIREKTGPKPKPREA